MGSVTHQAQKTAQFLQSPQTTQEGQSHDEDTGDCQDLGPGLQWHEGQA